MSTLDNKIAFVTGGSRGIGAAIVRELAANGATVVFTYAASAEKAQALAGEIKAGGGKALAIQADNRKVPEIQAAIQQAVDMFGRIDILVNNAGVFRAAPIGQLTLEDFEETMLVNLQAAFVAIKAVLGTMPDGGRIISIGSNLAIRTSGVGQSIYTASKAALTGLSQGIARDLGSRKITVNVVHPGSTDTDMNPADGPESEHQRALMANSSGFANPADVASAVAYLASPAAQSVTGAGWTVDNGANA